MNITWFGQNNFRISEKIDGKELIIITDPYSKEVGLFPSKFKADIVTVSNDNPSYNYTEKISGNIDQEPQILNLPGEYEIKRVGIWGIQTGKINEENVIYKFDIDGLKVAHLGALNSKLSEEEIDELGDIDILMIAVGGNNVLDGEKAAETVRLIEPRLVIPMHFKIKDLKVPASDESKFLKEMGGKAQTESKLKVFKKDLPDDQTKIIILEKN